MGRNPNRDPRLIEAQRIWQEKKREERRTRIAYEEALEAEIARIEEAGEADGLEAWRIAGERVGVERGEWKFWLGETDRAREEWKDLVWQVVAEKRRQWEQEGQTVVPWDEVRGISR